MIAELEQYQSINNNGNGYDEIKNKFNLKTSQYSVSIK